MSIDDEWKSYLKTIALEESGVFETVLPTEEICENQNFSEVPVCEDLYISTKTKVLFLNQEIDTHDVFWKLPVTEYWKQQECIIKKQMKIVSKSKEEFEQYQQKLIDVPYYIENVINQIDNPTARRIKFKDERKITI